MANHETDSSSYCYIVCFISEYLYLKGEWQIHFKAWLWKSNIYAHLTLLVRLLSIWSIFNMSWKFTIQNKDTLSTVQSWDTLFWWIWLNSKRHSKQCCALAGTSPSHISDAKNKWLPQAGSYGFEQLLYWLLLIHGNTFWNQVKIVFAFWGEEGGEGGDACSATLGAVFRWEFHINHAAIHCKTRQDNSSLYI